ncbi:hypothetical protein HOA56_03935, partial [archaeon]|nr:hypothetical protein [archaeon]
HKSKARFRIVVAGRRFGKSLLASRECMSRMIAPNQLVWIVAPTYELTRKVFREVYWGFHKYIPHWVSKSSDSELKIELLNGSSVQCKSADNPVSLIGEGVNFLIIDEASRISENVWTEALRPTLTDTEGDTLLISTPHGMNWFHSMFVRGKSKDEIDYESWLFPSSANPYLKEEEIAEAKRTLPERVFRQEYLAEFQTGAGAVFRNIKNCIKGRLEQPHHTAKYVIGVDLGRLVDFTVIAVLRCEEGHFHLCFMDRFNKIDWGLQKARIKSIAKRYNDNVCVIDSTGVGDAVFDDIAKENVNAVGFKIKSNLVKNMLVEKLAIAIENEEISFPNIPELVHELEAFSYTHSEKTGVTRYNAPSGLHDDCVIALALALQEAKNPQYYPMVGAAAIGHRGYY